jgi:hypothetical protein
VTEDCWGNGDFSTVIQDAEQNALVSCFSATIFFADSRCTIPTFCTIHEIADDDSQRFIVMDFLEGMTLKEGIGGHKTWGNKKNRDIGYALAANSCEGVGNVETCTVAVPDAITAFAVPNPGVSSQSRRFFRVWPSSESPRPTNHPSYFGLATIMKPTLSAIDATKVSASSEVVNARFLCNERVGDGPINAPNVPSVKASAGMERNSPQKRFCQPVEILLYDEHTEPWKSLDGVNPFNAWCCQEVEK